MTCYRRNAKETHFTSFLTVPFHQCYPISSQNRPANQQETTKCQLQEQPKSCSDTVAFNQDLPGLYNIYVPFEKLRQKHPIRSTAICQVRNDDSEEGVPTMHSVIHTAIPKLEAGRAWRTQRIRSKTQPIKP